MRLAQIRLAGFKSFVDPTTVHFPSSMTGIVGPNGCGKSNVIDGVRWVMGESSAKVLRGDSMADVIFNGSSTRKPVGTATVELLFDNSDGAMGGQYAGFAEISCKRIVSRDGVSAYYLNGTRCRRRDITDLFHGTGIGPRSYSIIEQGTISQFVEAKPDDLRVYLEEAAGISRYKERRRETENRMRHTRDNLSRLNDLRDEIGNQIAHLKRQARSAERYKVLKEEQRRREAELLALRWRELDTESSAHQQQVNVRQTELDKGIARQRSFEAELEKTREQHTVATDAFNAVQADVYEVGSEIARLEQEILHSRKLKQQRQQELKEAEEQHAEIEEHIALDRVQTEELRAGLAQHEPELNAAVFEQEGTESRLAGVELALQTWQKSWDQHTTEQNEQSSQAEVERTRIDHLDRHLLQLTERLERWQQQSSEISDEKIESDLDQVSELVNTAQEQIEAANAELDELREQYAERQTDNAQIEEGLHDARQELENLSGRLSSLQALQEAALGEGEQDIQDWLRDNRLLDKPRLADLLQVNPGWETAVQTALESHLETLAHDGDLDAVAHALGTLTDGSVSVMQAGPNQKGEAGLSSQVRGPAALHELLAGIATAEGLDEALALRAGLGDGESVITRDGVWLGRTWLRVSRQASSESGILHRRQAIAELEKAIVELEQDIASRRKSLGLGEEALSQTETDRDELQEKISRLQRQHAEACGKAEGTRTTLSQQRERRRQLTEEISQTRQHIENEASDLKSARSRLEQAIENMVVIQKRHEKLTADKSEVQQVFDTARDAAAVVRDRVHRLTIEVEKKRAALTSTEAALQRMTHQLEQLDARRRQLHSQIEEDEAPQAEREQLHKEKLDLRLAVDKRLGGARTKLETLDAEMRRLDQERVQAEAHAQDLRGAVEQQKLSGEGVRVRAQTVEEQIAKSGFDMQVLLAELPGDATLESWEEELQRVERRINRLGPINLAAIPEFEQQSERKEYLDSQHDDLTEALKTLENAIRKIDRETRTRFKETFDKVNQGLQELFPKLFGGGHAYLEMTGEDLLDTGIAVLARPPGKRISNIHLLSGGEKALTAVALVFAIFHLNPAPFCLLDEVDAPLDDTNVGRFCDMVKDMSEKVQFVIVTHNKLTMEIVNQLTGVTMSEPGVSRLVAVDIEEAAQLAAQSAAI
jgi:chromosome segregation protein